MNVIKDIKMKKTKITITNYKDTNLQENIHDLYAKNDMSDKDYDNISEKTSTIFEYGEFLNAEIIVDEQLNIIGGKIIPFK